MNVFQVAEWFLSRSKMTHKKLQKLCYYGQGWHMALEGRPLFSEKIEAWVHGPVIPELYQKYKSYGWQEIPQMMCKEADFSEGTLEVLRAVYETYGGFSGEQLERLTHSETPWQEARAGLLPYEVSTKEIKPELMGKYYLEKYQEAQDD